MASGCAGATPSGYPQLDELLPGGGWPRRGLIELLLQQNGIGEMRLLLPALQRFSGQRIALLQPPHLPQQQCAATAVAQHLLCAPQHI